MGFTDPVAALPAEPFAGDMIQFEGGLLVVPAASTGIDVADTSGMLTTSSRKLPNSARNVSSREGAGRRRIPDSDPALARKVTAAKKEAKQEVDDLHLLYLLSSGKKLADVANELGYSKTTVLNRVKRLRRAISSNLRLPVQVVDALIDPREAGSSDRRYRTWYSAPVVSIHQTLRLHDWYIIAEEVELAQEEVELGAPTKSL